MASRGNGSFSLRIEGEAREVGRVGTDGEKAAVEACGGEAAKVSSGTFMASAIEPSVVGWKWGGETFRCSRIRLKALVERDASVVCEQKTLRI